MSIYKTFFFIYGILIFFTACKSPFKKVYHSNYFQPGFECSSNPVGRSESKYNAYLKGWEIIKNEYKNQNLIKKTANIVLVGNSLVHLFPPQMVPEEFPQMDIVIRGIGGDRTFTLINRLEDNVFNLNPKIIIIEIGGNDLIDEKCLDFIETNVLKIITKIKAYNSDTKIIFLSVPPTTRPELNAIVPTYNAFLQKLAYDDKNIQYLDAWNEMRAGNAPTIKTEYIRERDEIHFNEKAYKIWGKLIREAVRK